LSKADTLTVAGGQ